MNGDILLETKCTEKVKGFVLKTLAYFDIFRYPLLAEEIRRFIPAHIGDIDIEDILGELAGEKIIYKTGKFYSASDDPSLAERRMKGNELAQKLLPRAAKIAAFLQRFPYVRAVAVSGSLSKNYSDEKGDIDFFIITKKNRLWIARTIMHLFKKLAILSGKRRLYCMNYYIDEESLLIDEKNIYTATEILTLLPLAGSPALDQFFAANNWTEKWLPNYSRHTDLPVPDSKSWLKRFSEWLFNNKMGEGLDNYLHGLTANRWKKKEITRQKNDKGRIMNLVTDKHWAKSDAGSFQQEVLSRYENKLSELKQRWPHYFDN
jgi:hypothetical protein